MLSLPLTTPLSASLDDTEEYFDESASADPIELEARWERVNSTLEGMWKRAEGAVGQERKEGGGGTRVVPWMEVEGSPNLGVGLEVSREPTPEPVQVPRSQELVRENGDTLT